MKEEVKYFSNRNIADLVLRIRHINRTVRGVVQFSSFSQCILFSGENISVKLNAEINIKISNIVVNSKGLFPVANILTQ